MEKRALVGVVVCGLIFLGGVANAETQKEMSALKGASGSVMEKSLAVHSLVGKFISNMGGANLGKVSDVVVDNLTNEVAYLVVTSGGFLGLGGREHVIPFHAVNIDDTGGLKVSMDIATFERAPARVPDMADRQWGRKVHEFYGVAPYWEEEWMPPPREMDEEGFDDYRGLD